MRASASATVGGFMGFMAGRLVGQAAGAGGRVVEVAGGEAVGETTAGITSPKSCFTRKALANS